MAQPVPIELILIVCGCVFAFCLFIVICYCTRNRVDGMEGMDYSQGRSTYIGPIGWFQRYQARTTGKPDGSPEVNRL